MAVSLQSSSSIMMRVTRRPMRPNPFTPMPAAAIDTVEPLEVVAFNDVPENE